MAKSLLPRFEAREKRPATMIYVIGMEGADAPVKIGVTFDIDVRLKGLQCGSPVKLTVHHMQDIGRLAPRFETAVHRALQDRWSHGEWFAVTPSEAIALIKKMATRVEIFAKLRTVRAVIAHVNEIDKPTGRTPWEIERSRRQGEQWTKKFTARLKERALELSEHPLSGLELKRSDT